MLRRVGVALGIAALVLLAGPVALDRAAAQSADDEVTADSDGWWTQTNVGAVTPDGAITPPLPRSPLVPEGSLPVAAFLGQPQTDAAINILLPEGMEATRLVMTLALAEGGESNVAQAALQACPILSFWGPTEDGKWADRPEADCTKASADGTRNDDGSWTFDLTPIATLWADEFESVAPNGVLLTEKVEPPATFQIAFAGLPDGITFDADLAPSGSAGGFDLPSGGLDAGPSGGGFSGGDRSFDAGPPPTPSAPAASGGSTRGPAQEQQASGRLAAASDAAGDLMGNLPLGLVLVVPLALAMAALAGLAASSRRSTAERVRRQGGVGRALATRSVRRSRPELP